MLVTSTPTKEKDMKNQPFSSSSCVHSDAAAAAAPLTAPCPWEDAGEAALSPAAVTVGVELATELAG